LPPFSAIPEERYCRFLKRETAKKLIKEVRDVGIADNIKRRRLELNISQQELADAMGYRSRSTIAKIEAGENEVPASKLVKLARVLDTTVDFLRTGVNGEDSYRSDPSGLPMQNKTAVIILAGGKSTRNMQNIPNQFINVLGKPVIVYCMEAYQRHPAVDDIYVVCLKDWESILEAYSKQYNIDKLRGVITAGETGILSVRKGIEAIQDKYDGNDVVIFQESTRPLVTEEMISKLLGACIRNGSAVTCEPMKDNIQFRLSSDEPELSRHSEYLNRYRVVTVESPEAYRFSTVKEVFETADRKGHRFDETCFAMLMNDLGFELRFYEGNHYNIKVIRQEDIAILSALIKNRM
jgi:2-C-methyl-D-erythritol 4-phosphate cytidylyltransferase